MESKEERIFTFSKKSLRKNFDIGIAKADVLLSETKFERLFKEVTGNTPIQFLNQMRLSSAKVLLQSTNNTITEIAQKCGFQTPSYFTSCFNKAYHMSPSEYASRF